MYYNILYLRSIVERLVDFMWGRWICAVHTGLKETLVYRVEYKQDKCNY